MAEIATIEDSFRVGKAYTFREAAKLAGVSTGTVRNWLYGAMTPEGYEMQAVFGDKRKSHEDVARVSFLELSELVVAARFRARRVKLERVREAHKFARTEWEMSHPFAHLDLASLGGHILARFEEESPSPTQGRLVVLTSPGQKVLLPELVQEELRRFDYADDNFAERWYPYGRDVPVVVDPHYGGGTPTIAGSGVSVEIVHKRWKAGEKVAFIALDFRLRRADVEAALQHVAA